MQHYRLGERYPIEQRRGIMGAPLATPEWYILTTPPQKEAAAIAWLDRNGIIEAWHPTETAWRNRPRCKPSRVEYQRSIAPGYLFALFPRAVEWDELFRRSKHCLSGVVGFHERPYAVPVRVLQQMQHVPHQIEKIRTDAAARAEAARLATLPQVGHSAMLKAGPLSGMTVDISRIDKGIAWFLLNGMEISADVDSMERLAK
jgi:transcription antitermination factor NusG